MLAATIKKSTLEYIGYMHREAKDKSANKKPIYIK